MQKSAQWEESDGQMWNATSCGSWSYKSCQQIQVEQLRTSKGQKQAVAAIGFGR